MLVCASLFWAGNFIDWKICFLRQNIPTDVISIFIGGRLVWLILLPFTYKEIIKNKKK